MTELLFILLEISLPIIILIAVGFGFQKIFKTDTRVLPKLMVFFIIPVVVFVKIFQAHVTFDFFLSVFPYVIMLMACMYLLSIIIGRIFHYKKSLRNATTNALTMFNSGNYGIPLIEISFAGNPVATASQLFIVIIQNIFSNTFGVFNASAGHTSQKQALKNIAKMPSLYAIALAVLFKLLKISIPAPIMIPLDYITGAFIAMALMTLGAQLAEVRLGHRVKEVLLATMVRVIASPLIGFGLVLLLGIKGILAQALIIGISTPTAVNSALLAKEFGNEPDFAAQVVLATTAFVTLTLPLVIWFVRIYF